MMYSHRGYPRFPDLRPIGTPIPDSRPNRETGDFPISAESGIGDSLPDSRPNRESGERELGISNSGGSGRGASSTQLEQSQAGPRGVLLAVGSTFASSLFVGPLLLFYFAL